MKDFDDVMTMYGIPYVIESGTLLGAVRHGGLIPWDDDLDLHMQEEHEPMFLKHGVPHLAALGYVTYPVGFGYKVNLASKGTKNVPSPFIDIFVSTIQKDRSVIRTNAFSNCYFSKRVLEMSPIRVPFGPLMLPMAPKPDEYLERCYGPDWNKHAVIFHGHMGSGKTLNVSHPDVHAAPYLPPWPLRSRVFAFS